MTKEDAINLLSKVKYPGYAKSIVDFKIIKSIDIKDEEIKIILNLATKNESIKKAIADNIKDAFKGSGMRLILSTVQDEPQSTAVEQKHMAETAKKRIAVLSAKGGVGKSTFSVSLAISLKRKGYKVGLFDADIHGPNVPRMLGTLNEKASMNENKKIMPVLKDGIYSMSLGYVVDQDTPVIWKGAMVTKAIVEMLEFTEWPDLDYFIVDLPPGTGDAALTIKQNMDVNSAIIITTPSALAIADALRTVDFFNQLGIEISGFVDNMAYFTCDECHNRLYPFGNVEPEEIEKNLGIPALGVVPFYPLIEESVDDGKIATLENKEYFDLINSIADKI